MITYGSVCSGIEAASIAWQPLGWRPAWFSETAPFPCAVLAYHWPDVPDYGDMRNLAPRIQQGEIAAPDVLVGGTPCQAFSITGRRHGLADSRGALIFSFIEVCNAIDNVRKKAGKKPAIIVWENVPGVLSIRDNAFGCFLAGLAGEKQPLQPAGKKWTRAGYVHGRQRKIAWRILNAQFFGVPQQRRRVFLVAGAGDIDPAEILFERNRLPGAGRTGKTQGHHTAREVTPGTDAAICIAGNTIYAVKYGGHGRGFKSDTCYTLMAASSRIHSVYARGRVRRLLPVEYERLQGLPDNHTQIPWRGRGAGSCPDSLRYTAAGNSMAVPVVRWIGERIAACLNDSLTQEIT